MADTTNSSLRPRVIAVTGAASGMGQATTARLRADGHNVITIDLHNADVDVDLRSRDDRQRAVTEVLDRCGGALDGLVTFAGLVSMPSRPDRDVAAVNYFGSIELISGLRPALAKGRAPAAVAISSNVTTHSPGISRALIDACLAGNEELALKIADEVGGAYGSSKTAVAWWVRRNAVTPDWIGAGITLNAFAPGATETPMSNSVRNDPVMGEQFKQYPVPLGRFARAEEVAGIIAFLLGPEARTFVGSVVFADAGSDALLRPDAWPSPMEPLAG